MSEIPDLSRSEAAFPDVSELEKMQASEFAVEHALLEDAATMVATVANSEAKALTFAAMALERPGETLSKRQIYDLFLGIQGDQDPAWADASHKLPGNYARDSFEPVGSVVKSEEQTARGVAEFYTTTKYGERVGLALTGLMLDLSLRHPDISLYELFGRTATTSEADRRAPFHRLEILTYLNRAGSAKASNIDIVRSTGMSDSAVSANIMKLQKNGILESSTVYTADTQTEISISDAYKDVIAELVSRVQDIMQGDEQQLDWGEEQALEILSDPAKVNALLAKARETSPFKQNEPVEMFENRVTSILGGKKLNATEIHTKVADQGKPTTVASVQRILRGLEQKGTVAFEYDERNKKVYYLAE